MRCKQLGLKQTGWITIAGAAAGLVAMGLTGPAIAQEAPADGEKEDYLTALRSCQLLSDDTARLACYDAAVGNVVTATDQGDLQLVDREDVTKTRRRLFGFSLPDLGIFGGGENRKEEDRALDILQSTITKVNYGGRDTITFVIEEGDAVWRINDAPMRLARVKPGDRVEFKKASLGSYFIRINGQTGVKGRRVK